MDNDIIIGNELAPVPYDLFVKVIRPPLVAFDVLMVKMGVGNNPDTHKARLSWLGAFLILRVVIWFFAGYYRSLGGSEIVEFILV